MEFLQSNCKSSGILEVIRIVHPLLDSNDWAESEKPEKTRLLFG